MNQDKTIIAIMDAITSGQWSGSQNVPSNAKSYPAPHEGRHGEIGGSAPRAEGASSSIDNVSTVSDEIAPNATGGNVRQIAGKKQNTADLVNTALTESNKTQLDLVGAEHRLNLLGNKNPTLKMIHDYARQMDVLQRLERATGANVSGQIGKWNFKNAQTIHDSFNSYLERRIGGQHARWTERTKQHSILSD